MIQLTSRFIRDCSFVLGGISHLGVGEGGWGGGREGGREGGSTV